MTELEDKIDKLFEENELKSKALVSFSYKEDSFALDYTDIIALKETDGVIEMIRNDGCYIRVPSGYTTVEVLFLKEGEQNVG